MKLALAGAAAALLAVVAALVIVIGSNRDTTPDTVRSCARDAGAKLVAGTDRLGPLRVDLLAGTLRPSGPQLELRGAERAAFLVPSDGAYLAVVVARGAIADPVRAISVAPGQMVMVAYALRPAAAALRACVTGQRST